MNENLDIIYTFIRATIYLIVGLNYFLGGRIVLSRALSIYFIYSGIRHIFYLAFLSSIGLGITEYQPESYAVFLALRYIGYLLLVYSFYDLLKNKASIHYQALTAVMIAAVLGTAFFTPGWGNYYYIPRLIIFSILALHIGESIKRRSLSFLYVSVMSAVWLVSDLFKMSLSQDALIYKAQLYIDTALSQAVPFMLLAVMLMSGFVQRLHPLLQQFTAQHPARLVHNIVPFPKKSEQAVSSSHRFDDESLENDLADVDEMFIKLASVATVSKKDYLSIEDLAIYLDVSPQEAEAFVEDWGIRKHTIGDTDRWLVSKEDIRNALEKRE